MAPDPAPILSLLTAFRDSAVLFAGLSLGVFERLASPASLADLAKDLACDADALGRLLERLVGLGLLRREGETFAISDTATTYLTRSSPRRLTGYLAYSAKVLWPMWGDLAGAVREGKNRWKACFGLEGPLFANCFANDDDTREFLLGMHGFGQISSPLVAEAFDLTGFRHLCDLGGATGHLAVAACRRWPQLRATVLDLPAAVPLAMEMIAADSDMAGRVEVMAGDFFAEALPPADLYTAGRILHDWSEEKIARLLNAVLTALPTGGALLVAEKLLDDDRAGPAWAQLQSLNMLVCAEGKERTSGEYEALLKKAGFSRVEARRCSGPLDAVMAWK